MQTIVSSSATDQEISDLQQDPAIQKLFKDAIEVLRFVGADENATGKYTHHYCFWTELKKCILILVSDMYCLFFVGGGVGGGGVV